MGLFFGIEFIIFSAFEDVQTISVNALISAEVFT